MANDSDPDTADISFIAAGNPSCPSLSSQCAYTTTRTKSGGGRLLVTPSIAGTHQVSYQITDGDNIVVGVATFTINGGKFVVMRSNLANLLMDIP